MIENPRVGGSSPPPGILLFVFLVFDQIGVFG